MGRYSYIQPLWSSGNPSSSTSAVPSFSEQPEVTSPTNFRRYGKGRYGSGFSDRCVCGLVPVLKASIRDENPGPVFYGCKNYKDGGDHIFKWWDEAVTQEIQNLRCAGGKKAGQRDRLAEDSSAYLPRIDAELSQLCCLIERHYPGVVMKKLLVTGLIVTLIGLTIYLATRYLRS